ncbi:MULTISPECIES: hypothetical protein [Pectobacterium]|uniref:Uncharacterized protein n=1 Tax=Pectobacterium brasiliense TaxID=180957 RepID=A0A3S1AGW7_9GAMM|nr:MULTISPECIES: hypothetical protein [Pectobacterium]GKW29483.1 hypothetical protein PEC331060_26610 [Pectobacterium carotovorum subsp. carotovorum]MBN3048113.1 hypothetical protein [Pectobacterium brasiliense]MBN3077600.1 hypothetical protein [Pectobacterium brasiliense]MBN3086933.1 hypothetical protein [Pectobacterium brasiliense]MBN3091565.1 hypothetical protein [Pectobacterium brasiliense]
MNMNDLKVNFTHDGQVVIVGIHSKIKCKIKHSDETVWIINHSITVDDVKYRQSDYGRAWERMIEPKDTRQYRRWEHSAVPYYYFRKVTSIRIISLLNAILQRNEVKKFNWGEG